MRGVLLLLVVLALPAEAGEYAVVVSAETEIVSMESRLIRDVFLRKRQFANKVRLFPLNLTGDTMIRQRFEQAVLGMEREELNQYWVESHFRGVSPPGTQASFQAMKRVLVRVDGAITYLPRDQVDQSLRVVYEF